MTTRNKHRPKQQQIAIGSLTMRCDNINFRASVLYFSYSGVHLHSAQAGGIASEWL